MQKIKIIEGKTYTRIGNGVYLSCPPNNASQPSTHSTSGNRNFYPAPLPGPYRTPDPRTFPTVPSPFTPLWTLSTEHYRMQWYMQKEAEERELKARQEAAINAALDRAASAQYQVMEKLYLEGGLDAMQKEYHRLCSGTEGANSVYARAAYNSLCAKTLHDIYLKNGLDGLRAEYHRLCSGTEGANSVYARAAYNAISAREKEEATNTPVVTKSANEYYDTGGISSLRHLVKYYEDNNYPVYANIAKRTLKEKEEQEEKLAHEAKNYAFKLFADVIEVFSHNAPTDIVAAQLKVADYIINDPHDDENIWRNALIHIGTEVGIGSYLTRLMSHKSLASINLISDSAAYICDNFLPTMDELAVMSESNDEYVKAIAEGVGPLRCVLEAVTLPARVIELVAEEIVKFVDWQNERKEYLNYVRDELHNAARDGAIPANSPWHPSLSQKEWREEKGKGNLKQK